MKKNEIISNLAKERFVESILSKYIDGNMYINDCAQDIYLSLLEKPDEKIEKLYEDNQLKFYVIGIIKNNVISVTSKFYKNYIKFQKSSLPLDNFYNISSDDLRDTF